MTTTLKFTRLSDTTAFSPADFDAALARKRATRPRLSPAPGALGDELKIAEMVKAIRGLSDLDLADPVHRTAALSRGTFLSLLDLCRLDCAALDVERIRRKAMGHAAPAHLPERAA